MGTRTITVKGTGEISQKPDLIIITMSLEAIDLDYKKTLERAEAELGFLKTALLSVGHKSESIVTSNFNVRTKYENRYEQEMWKETFVGYLCEHSLRLEFDYDLPVLEKTIEAITDSNANPRFNIVFSIKDQESLKSQLLERAVADSARKAEIIANAAGVKLQEIEKIEYTWTNLRLDSSSGMEMNSPIAAAGMIASRMKLDIVPDEVKATDTVTVIWEID
jgi:uncharacterized protein YggE